MLIDFKFTNCTSFKDTAELDLTAAKITEYPHHIVQTAGEKILRIAAIYGANASGKSNIHNALKYMQKYVLTSFGYGEDTHLPENKTFHELPTPFLFDTQSKTKDTTFDIWFTLPNDEKEITYNYGFSLNKEKVTEEWLNYKTRTGREYKPVFYRETDNSIEFNKIPEEYHKNLTISLNNSTLLVSLGAKLKVEILTKIYNWFTTLILMDFGNPLENLFLTTKLPTEFIKNPDERKKTAEYINTFDPSITDFNIEKVRTPDNKEGYALYSVHTDKTTGKKIPIPFDYESAGTRKMFSLYEPLKQVLTTGGVLFIDELNDRLHPLLVRNIIQTFIDPERNQKNAQLIFTTHDVWQLSSKLFRRDEIWFTEKEDDGATTLYSLTDFKGECNEKARNDSNILKNYLIGKYGAIPELEIIDFFK